VGLAAHGDCGGGYAGIGWFGPQRACPGGDDASGWGICGAGVGRDRRYARAAELGSWRAWGELVAELVGLVPVPNCQLSTVDSLDLACQR